MPCPIAVSERKTEEGCEATRLHERTLNRRVGFQRVQIILVEVNHGDAEGQRERDAISQEHFRCEHIPIRRIQSSEADRSRGQSDEDFRHSRILRDERIEVGCLRYLGEVYFWMRLCIVLRIEIDVGSSVCFWSSVDQIETTQEDAEAGKTPDRCQDDRAEHSGSLPRDPSPASPGHLGTDFLVEPDAVVTTIHPLVAVARPTLRRELRGKCSNFAPAIRVLLPCCVQVSLSESVRLFLFDLIFQMFRAGFRRCLLAVKRVFLVHGIREHDNSACSVYHLDAGRIVGMNLSREGDFGPSGLLFLGGTFENVGGLLPAGHWHQRNALLLECRCDVVLKALHRFNVNGRPRNYVSVDRARSWHDRSRR